MKYLGVVDFPLRGGSKGRRIVVWVGGRLRGRDHDTLVLISEEQQRINIELVKEAEAGHLSHVRVCFRATQQQDNECDA